MGLDGLRTETTYSGLRVDRCDFLEFAGVLLLRWFCM